MFRARLLALFVVSLTGLVGLAAQAPATKPAATGDKAPVAKPAAPSPAPEKPAEKAAPIKPAAEPSDIKLFTFANDGELADMTQFFTSLYAKMSPGAKAPKFTSLSRTKTVIIRGTKSELEHAEVIVKLIQGTTDAKGPQVAKLKTAKVDEVVNALIHLDMDGRVLALRGTNSLVVLPGFEADAEQLKKVIEAFEKVEPKSTTKTAAPKPRNDD